MNMEGEPWTEGQILHLLDWLPKYGVAETARKLGRSSEAVRAKRANLRDDPATGDSVAALRARVWELHKSGLGPAEIAQRINQPESNVKLMIGRMRS